MLLTNTTLRVTPLAVGLGDGAALVGPLGGGIDPAVGGRGVEGRVECAGSSGVLGFASVGGDGVGGRQVPLLVDVELTTLGPVRSIHPEGGPGTAHGLGEVGEVGDDQTVVVPAVGLESDTGSPSEAVVLTINADGDIVTGRGDEPGVESDVAGHVVDKPMGRVNGHVVRCWVLPIFIEIRLQKRSTPVSTCRLSWALPAISRDQTYHKELELVKEVGRVVVLGELVAWQIAVAQHAGGVVGQDSGRSHLGEGRGHIEGMTSAK